MSTEDSEINSLGECPACGYAFQEKDILDGSPPLYGEPTVRCPNYDGTDPEDEHRDVFEDIEGTPHSVRVSNLK
ncbi:hypothetical protein [Natrarchaeobaculum aegyptiacum]|uniref:hypothetical protein n=1 Tax=Natrarchaeobaculum aegyptiacum TaxID=745377 RepID=UPI0012601191|nr:hypothetical protein [Natrarchaeobaculum aegyptiacum]